MADSKKYKREWARRERARRKAENPLWGTLAGGRPSRAKKLPRASGECTACGKIKPSTAEFFQSLRIKRKGKPDWCGLSAECRECRKGRFREFYDDNREAQIARANAYCKKYPEKKNARDMARYAATIAPQMPAWADRRKIETIYAIADFLTARTGIEHEVDHVFPLKGKMSCGLHVETNLRVVTALENQRKGNRGDSTWRNE